MKRKNTQNHHSTNQPRTKSSPKLTILICLVTPLSLSMFIPRDNSETNHTLLGDPVTLKTKHLGGYIMKSEGKLSKACSSLAMKDMKFHNSATSMIRKNEMGRNYHWAQDYQWQYFSTQNEEYLTSMSRRATSLMIPHMFILFMSLWLLVLTGVYFCCRLGVRAHNRCLKFFKLYEKAGGGGQQSGESEATSTSNQYMKSSKLIRFISSKRPRMLIYCLSILLVLICLLLLVSSYLHIYLAVEEGLKKADCSLSVALAATEHGFYNPEGKIKKVGTMGFIGLRGLRYLNSAISSESKETNGFVLNDAANDVGAAGDMLRSAKAFKTEFKEEKVSSPGNSSLKITPGLVDDLKKTGLFSEVINSASLFTEVADDLKSFKESSDKFSNGSNIYMLVGTTAYSLALTGVYSGLKEIEEWREQLDYNAQGKFLLHVIHWIFLTFFISIVGYITFFTASYKLRVAVKLSVFCQAIFAVMILLYSCFFNALAVSGFVLSVMGNSACLWSESIVVTRNYSIAYLPPEFVPFVESCVYGDRVEEKFPFVQNLSENNRNAFLDTLSLAVPAMTNISILDKQLDEKNENISAYYTQNLLKTQKYEKRGLGRGFQRLFGFEDIEYTELDKLNKLLECTRNEVRFHPQNCTKSPIYKTTDYETFKNNEPYCMVLPLLKYNSIEARYSGVDCLKNETFEKFKNLKAFTNSMDALLLRMEKNYRDRLESVSRNSINFLKMNFHRAHIESKNQFKKASQMMGDSGYKAWTDCGAVKPLIHEFASHLCFGFIYHITHLIDYLLFLGPLLTLLGCLNFLSVMGTRIKVVETDLYGRGAVFDVNDPRLQEMRRNRGQEIEEVAEGWIGNPTNINFKRAGNQGRRDDWDGFGKLWRKNRPKEDDKFYGTMEQKLRQGGKKGGKKGGKSPILGGSGRRSERDRSGFGQKLPSITKAGTKQWGGGDDDSSRI